MRLIPATRRYSPVSLADLAGAVHLSFPPEDILAAFLFLPLAESCCQNCPAGSTMMRTFPGEPPREVGRPWPGPEYSILVTSG